MLNYNHLRYFWAVAKEGHLTRAAERLNVSQSALSAQIKKLENQLGHALFERRGRGLVLSSAGQIAMAYCDTIFAHGEALQRRLKDGLEDSQPVLRVGAISTLSRNFQLGLLRPFLADGSHRIVIRSGSMAELLAALEAHVIDLVLVNQVPLRDSATRWTARVLDEQPVSLIGTPERVRGRTDYAELMTSEPLILPTGDSGHRNDIDLIAERLDHALTIAAEVDDMAMLRLLAREDAGLAVLPPIVVRDELASGQLVEACQLPGIVEEFSVITLKDRFAHPALEALLAA
ncbi:LysR family transcriptional regulator [Erythrobacter sp. HA6-11]